MLHPFADLCPYVDVLVAEVSQAVIAPHDHRPGPVAHFSDREGIALAVVAELVGLDEEPGFLASVARNHRALFPRLPERARHHRRRRQRGEGTNRIRAALLRLVLRQLTPQECALCVLDRLPVPVVGFAHARGDHRRYGEASDGAVASKRQTIFGDKLPLRATRSGLILAFALAPAQHADGALAEQLLLAKAGLTVRGDKASRNAALPQLLAWRNDLVLLTPRRANQRPQPPAALTRAIAHVRQASETRNNQLAEQVHLAGNQATSVAGRCARLQAKLAAHTIGLLLTCLPGRPLLALKARAVI